MKIFLDTVIIILLISILISFAFVDYIPNSSPSSESIAIWLLIITLMVFALYRTVKDLISEIKSRSSK